MSNTVSLAMLNKRYWERTHGTELLGCAECLDRRVCGGIRPDTGVFSCRDYCCGSPGTCTRICENRPEDFVDRRREVQGWELDNIPRFDRVGTPAMPAVISEIYHASGRTEPLSLSVVAVPLRLLIGRTATQCRFGSKSSLLAHLRIGNRAKLVIDGIGRDRWIESYWAQRRLSDLVEAFSRLRPAWIIAPNYSVITDVPRWENLHAIKRIAIVWSEFMNRGIPTALTLNARTDKDWERWTDFVIARPEVEAVAVELGTGAKYADRRSFMLPRLRDLGLATNGRLRLFMRGGRSVQSCLREAFSNIHVIDTNAFMKAVYRQRVVVAANGLASKRSFTLIGQPIEQLLSDNVRASR